MKKIYSITTLLTFLFLSGFIFAKPALSPLQEKALKSQLGWQIIESLTTEVGPRLAGSAKDVEAVAWMEKKLTALGFDKVWTEPVTFPRWIRNRENAQMIAPFSQSFAVTALGGSPGTLGEIKAEVVEFADYKALEAVANGSLLGKIAYISNRMQRFKDGHGYGEAVVARSRGPYLAHQKGAIALLIRSVGTDSERLPHTGNISNSQHSEPEKGLPVAAAALSSPDADLLSHAIARGVPVKLSLELDVGYLGEHTSYNVIGEITGNQHPDEIIVVGGHLDSWDLGTGAIDDAAGIGIMTAAARLVADNKRPARSIWVVGFANEEQGLYGATAFAKAHGQALDKFMLGGESDFGAGNVYRFRLNVRPEVLSRMQPLTNSLAALGIEFDPSEKAGGDADVGRLRAAGVAVIDLSQNGTRYFDWHHTANDTLDKINPEDLAQNIAAWVSVIDFAANSTLRFGPVVGTETNQVGQTVLENNRKGKK